MCAVAKPASSIARSTASASAASLVTPSIAGPPACPASVGARTSCRRSSAGRTSSHVRQVSVKPCRQTSGGPDPPRCDAVNVTDALGTMVVDDLDVVAVGVADVRGVVAGVVAPALAGLAVAAVSGTRRLGVEAAHILLAAGKGHVEILGRRAGNERERAARRA